MNYRDVFGEILADHHESPRNWGVLDGPCCTEGGYNPLCGDKVSITFRTGKDGAVEKVQDLAISGEGCSICMASASIMSELVKGQNVRDVLALVEAFRMKMQGEESVPLLPSEDSGEDVTALYGIKRFPVRIKCALLPWTTLKKGLESSHA